MTRRGYGVALAALLSLCMGNTPSAPGNKAFAEYAESQARLERGWNTWDTHTVLSQVLLPEGSAINIRIER